MTFGNGQQSAGPAAATMDKQTRWKTSPVLRDELDQTHPVVQTANLDGSFPTGGSRC